MQSLGFSLRLQTKQGEACSDTEVCDRGCSDLLQLCLTAGCLQELWRYCLRQRPEFPHMYVAYQQLRAQVRLTHTCCFASSHP